MLVRDRMRCMAALGTPVKGGWQERPAKPAAPPCSPVQCYTSIHDIIYSLLLFMNTGSLVLLTPTGGRCGCEFEFRLLKGAERDQSCRKRQPRSCRKRQPVAQEGNQLPEEEVWLRGFRTFHIRGMLCAPSLGVVVWTRCVEQTRRENRFSCVRRG